MKYCIVLQLTSSVGLILVGCLCLTKALLLVMFDSAMNVSSFSKIMAWLRSRVVAKDSVTVIDAFDNLDLISIAFACHIWKFREVILS